MKTLITASMLCLCLAVKAQKLEKPHIDKITGDTTFSTKDEVLSNKFSLNFDYLSCNVTKSKKYTFLGFHLMKGITVLFTVRKTDSLVVKFEDGSLLHVPSGINQHSQLAHQSGANSEAFLEFSLTEEQINKLKTNQIAVIRIETSEVPFDYEVSNSKAEIIKKELSLFK